MLVCYEVDALSHRNTGGVFPFRNWEFQSKEHDLREYYPSGLYSEDLEAAVTVNPTVLGTQ